MSKPAAPDPMLTVIKRVEAGHQHLADIGSGRLGGYRLIEVMEIEAEYRQYCVEHAPVMAAALKEALPLMRDAYVAFDSTTPFSRRVVVAVRLHQILLRLGLDPNHIYPTEVIKGEAFCARCGVTLNGGEPALCPASFDG